MTSQVTSKHKYAIKAMNEIMDMSSPEHKEMIASHHYKTLWTYAANIILGAWLITSPILLDYKSNALAISDIVSGALIIFFEMISFAPKRDLWRWGTCGVGFWLLFAPLIFWSPTPTVFLVDSIVACLLIAFSILIPGMPLMGGMEMTGPDKPPGWTYNPSSWIQRAPMIALSLFGFFISRYLAAY